MTNLFAGIPVTSPDEVVTSLVANPAVRIERIVSFGQASPDSFWYDQDQDEWVIVLKGEGRIQFENKTVHLKAGDHLLISAHQKHRVEWTTPTEPTVWLAVHYPVE